MLLSFLFGISLCKDSLLGKFHKWSRCCHLKSGSILYLKELSTKNNSHIDLSRKERIIWKKNIINVGSWSTWTIQSIKRCKIYEFKQINFIVGIHGVQLNKIQNNLTSCSSELLSLGQVDCTLEYENL